MGMPVKHVSTKPWKDKKRLLLIASVALIVVLIAYAALNWMGGSGGGGGGGSGGGGSGGGGGGGGGGSGGGGGGGGGGNDTSTPPPGVVLYPNGDLVYGFNAIFIEDHVEAEGDHYRVTSRLVSVFRSLVAYGGSGVTGNITYGSAYIIYGYYKIPVVGFASTNSIVIQDFPGMKVRLMVDGGYVVYTPVSMAVYYRRYTFDIGSTTVYVWVPAKSLPSVLTTEASQHVYIDPETAFYYVNGAPYRLIIDAPPTRTHVGVLRSWVLYANRYSSYMFQINP
jgi:hypothetical protein